MRKILKLLVAVAVAFAPSLSSAFASSGTGRINAQVLSLEEMQSEFGAGGSGGGSDGGSSGGGFGGSPSGICSVDLDYDAYCDSVWYQNGTTRYADQVAYARVLGPINLPCNPTTLSPEQSFCTFNLAAQFGVSTVFSAGMDVNTPLGNVDLGVEVSGSISVGLSREDIKVARGYIDTYTIEKSGTRYSGQYTFAYYDKYDNYFQQVTTGFSYSGTKASGYWEKVIWRYMYPAKPLSRKVW